MREREREREEGEREEGERDRVERERERGGEKEVGEVKRSKFGYPNAAPFHQINTQALNFPVPLTLDVYSRL